MPAARNAPCPCGSGRKYKHCCGKGDPDRPPLQLAPAADPPPWEVDLVPVPVSLGNDRDARPGIILVVAGGQVLHQDLLSHPPSEPTAIAVALAKTLHEASARIGIVPSTIQVRGTPVAGALAGLDLPGGASIESATRLPGIDHAAQSLLGFLTGSTDRPTRSSSGPTWRSWGLPADQIAELFRAAAAFFRAAPWRGLDNEDLLTFESGAGPAWTLCVMGAGGEEFGLALYEDKRDFQRLIRAASAVQGFASMQGVMVSVTFGRRQDLPKPMRKEVLVAGWEVAAPDAYPVLVTTNTPGAGVTAALARELVAALRAVTGFATQHGAELRRGTGGRYRWTDPDSAATVTLSLKSRAGVAGGA